MTDQPKTFPNIQGRCPACRGDSLFTGTGGYVTCSRIECPNPSAADQLLHAEHVTASTPLVCSDERHTAKVAALEAELARLRAGEEDGYDERVLPTPGQWIARWNQATPEERLLVAAAAMRDGETANRCFFMAHEKRLDEAREAWARLTRTEDEVTRWKHHTLEPQTARALDDISRALRPAPATAAPEAVPAVEPPLLLPRDTATTLHRALGQLLGDEDAQAIARVRALHRDEYGLCFECTHEFSVPYPCPTITALDAPKEA